LQLIDFNDGGDSVAADNDWQIITTIDLSAAASAWHTLSVDYNPATGAVVAKHNNDTFNFNTSTDLIGTFYVGYREALPGTGNSVARPPTYDMFVAAAPIPGDYDSNGIVETADYTKWKTTFGTNVTAGSNADGNGNGIVDAADYTVWRDHLGNSSGSGSGSAVPEPGTLLLAGGVLAMVAAGVRRRAL